jgi:DNA polymerase III alpha subunit (gram-positive type)
MTHFFVDIETTGLNPKIHGIFSISIRVRVDDQLVESKTIHMDTTAYPWDSKAWEMHQYVIPTLNGVTQNAGVYEFLAICQKYTINEKAFMVAYNASFDFDFIHEWLRVNHIKIYDFFYSVPICVMHLANYRFQKHRAQLPNMKLTTICAGLNIPLEAHNSDSDIDATIKVYDLLNY